DFMNRTTTYGYDALGRVTSRLYPDSTSVSFTYTPDGRRSTAVDTRGATSYAYDSRRRITRMTYPDGRALAYGYDPRGMRSTLTAIIGTQQLTTTTTYDAAGRVSPVQDPWGPTLASGFDRANTRTHVRHPQTRPSRHPHAGHTPPPSY